MVLSIYENLAQESPKPRFTVGIEDDVTHLSLPVGPWLNVLPEGTTECMFYGLGSDGTVGANKSAVKMIAMGTELHAQAKTSSAFLVDMLICACSDVLSLLVLDFPGLLGIL